LEAYIKTASGDEINGPYPRGCVNLHGTTRRGSLEGSFSFYIESLKSGENLKIVSESPTNLKNPITFPDPNLEASIRTAVNKPEGSIYAEDLKALRSLNASNMFIINIAGLEYCTDLDSLHLRLNQITDMSPLSGLTILTYLDLSYNHITDASALSGLTNLSYLDLSYNHITNASALSSLTNLDYSI
jgi:internalin A